MAREGYDIVSALKIAGETPPYKLEKRGNNEIYSLNDGTKALVKFSKYFKQSKAYWYGITPGQIELFSKEPIDYYFFITGYIGVLKVPIELLRKHLLTCNISQVKGHPDRIRHYHVMIQYSDESVGFVKGPNIANFFYFDDDTDNILETEIQSQSKMDLLKSARDFVNAPEAFIIVEGKRKVRKESRAQKYRVACIEDFTCQVCGFRESYLNESGDIKFIYEVDHINNKALGYGESLDNLWVLCPNCHEKKTRGIIKVDFERKRVLEHGKRIEIRDSHLFTN